MRFLFVAIFGAVTISLTIAVILKTVEMTNTQKNFKEFIDKYQLELDIKHCAASLIQQCKLSVS